MTTDGSQPMTTPSVLTTDSTVTCAHSGTVEAASTTRLTVGGVAVLLAPVAGKTISGCTVVDDANTSTKHCATVGSTSAGESSKLTVGGVSVVSDQLAGFSDGQPPPPPGPPLAAAVANQTRLRAAAGA
jgi:hypothetical protein